jgi:LysR family glycine cleavage system transcriptional activator
MRLFERLPRSLRLTEMGEAYLPAVRDIFEDPVRRDQRAVRRSEQASLTVRVQVAYAATWLAPRLPDFCESFPYIDLKLVSAIWADALPPSEIDLKIRQGNGYWPDASQLSGEASAFIRWLRAQDLLDPPAPHRPVQPNHAE